MNSNVFMLNLRDDYKISPSISRITSEEWEIILNYVSDLLSKHETIFNNFNDNSIREELSIKYDNQITTLQLQTATYEAEIEEMTNKITQLSKTHKKELKNKIKELRQEIEQEYKVMMEEKYDTLILLEKSKVSNKDIIISTLTDQLANVQSTIAQTYADQLSNLQNKLDRYEVMYNETKLNNQKQIDEIIINTRTAVTKQIEEQYINQLNKLQQDLINQDQQHKLQQSKLEKDIELKYSMQINTQKQLEEQYQSRLKEYESNTSLLSKFESLNNKLVPMLKHYGGSNNDRGTSGENMIFNILTKENTYLDAVIEDTSGQTSRGDIMFMWRQLKCLIEVKNKKTLTKKDDMDKFVKDIQLSIESDYKINCAVFVTIDTDIMPGRSRDIIQLDFIHNIPVIYIYTPPPCKEIHYAIACLEKIIHTKVSTNEQEKELQIHFKNYYNHIITYQKYFEKTLAVKRREINSLNKHLELFNALCEQLAPMNMSINIDVDVEDKNVDSNNGGVVDENKNIDDNNVVESKNDITIDTIEQTEELTGEYEDQYSQIINAYINLTLTKKTSPTLATLCSYFNIRSSVITEFGGYKKIVSDAKLLFTKTIVPDSKVKIIMKYYSINNAFPSRQELISRKILSDGSIRKLNKIVKVKRLLEYIYDYCRSVAKDIDDDSDEENNIDNVINDIDVTDENNIDENVTDNPENDVIEN